MQGSKRLGAALCALFCAISVAQAATPLQSSAQRALRQARVTLCSPVSTVKPTVVAPICPRGSFIVSGPGSTGAPLKCGKCPEGYSWNATAAKCLLVRCPKPSIAVDTDGPANGLRCCACTDKDFPSFLVALGKEPACYARCPEGTFAINFPIPKCCSTKCPSTPPGLVPSSNPEYCRTTSRPIFSFPRNCKEREPQKPTCRDLAPAVDPTPVDPVCPSGSLGVLVAGVRTCYTCSNGRPSLDPAGNVVCPPKLADCPPKFRKCGPYCYSPQDSDLAFVLGLLSADRCKAFLANFADCIKPCPPIVVVPP